jgi:uncharacterized protein YndB with AHSA1/START domain
MLSQPEPACLVIADISGYTGFLAGAELDHAQDILADLMATVVGALRPAFKLAKLEGDAAFVYTITEAVDAAQLQDMIERCYFGFQRRLRDVRQASTCECNACILVPKLDLKVVAHHGHVVRQRFGSWEELVGSDVIVVHRLLKNHIEQSTGLTAYAMYTEACTTAMGLHDPAAAGFLEHAETFEGVGEIRTWIRDLHAAWDAEQRRARLVVDGKDIAQRFAVELEAPPPLVWDYVTSPVRRPQWQSAVSGVVEAAAAPGRRGIGTVNHCIHGKDAVIEEVLDWEPYDHVTYRSLMPIPNVPKLLSSYVFTDLGGGRTGLEMRFGRPRSARDRAIAETLMPMVAGMVNDSIERLRPVVEAAALAAKQSATPEPEIPVAQGRNVREPVARAV